MTSHNEQQFEIFVGSNMAQWQDRVGPVPESQMSNQLKHTVTNLIWEWEEKCSSATGKCLSLHFQSVPTYNTAHVLQGMKVRCGWDHLTVKYSWGSTTKEDTQKWVTASLGKGDEWDIISHKCNLKRLGLAFSLRINLPGSCLINPVSLPLNPQKWDQEAALGRRQAIWVGQACSHCPRSLDRWE